MCVEGEDGVEGVIGDARRFGGKRVRSSEEYAGRVWGKI